MRDRLFGEVPPPPYAPARAEAKSDAADYAKCIGCGKVGTLDTGCECTECGCDMWNAIYGKHGAAYG